MQKHLLLCRFFCTRKAVLYGGCAWETFGSAGFALFHRFANLRTAATHSFGDV
ncbi:hypothetical protein [Pseudomonas kitaguniensis]|uniref:hypothetical protein n=1 Tax=Pseudomonas kitaguniensis TaxID=2607908 RepID=UPI003D02728F